MSYKKLNKTGTSTNRALVTWDGTGGDDLFNNSSATIDSSGRMLNTSQPAFLALSIVNQLNATGAGAVATANFTSEIFDQGSNYDGTNTFTAPVTGRYSLASDLLMGGLTAAMTAGQIRLVTSNRTYTSDVGNIGANRSIANFYNTDAHALADMDAADTARIDVTIANGAGDTAFITGNPDFTYFFGHVTCVK